LPLVLAGAGVPEPGVGERVVSQVRRRLALEVLPTLAVEAPGPATLLAQEFGAGLAAAIAAAGRTVPVLAP